MSMIMVSYRRADQDAARLIADYLITKYGESSVFFDVDSIPTGMNFHDRISNAISACDVVVAIIGPHWIGKLEGELATRLANPADSVRVEIEMAQKFRKPIFPILMNGITMPQRSDLPEELRFLVDYNAARIDSGQDFRYHMSKLTAAIDKISAPATGWLLAPLRRFWMAGVGSRCCRGHCRLDVVGRPDRRMAAEKGRRNSRRDDGWKRAPGRSCIGDRARQGARRFSFS